MFWCLKDVHVRCTWGRGAWGFWWHYYPLMSVSIFSFKFTLRVSWHFSFYMSVLKKKNCLLWCSANVISLAPSPKRRFLPLQICLNIGRLQTRCMLDMDVVSFLWLTTTLSLVVTPPLSIGEPKHLHIGSTSSSGGTPITYTPIGTMTFFIWNMNVYVCEGCVRCNLGPTQKIGSFPKGTLLIGWEGQIGKCHMRGRTMVMIRMTCYYVHPLACD